MTYKFPSKKILIPKSAYLGYRVMKTSPYPYDIDIPVLKEDIRKFLFKVKTVLTRKNQSTIIFFEKNNGMVDEFSSGNQETGIMFTLRELAPRYSHFPVRAYKLRIDEYHTTKYNFELITEGDEETKSLFISTIVEEYKEIYMNMKIRIDNE